MTLVDLHLLNAMRAERDAALAKLDAAQEHLAYHLRDYALNGEHTGDLAVDLAAWAQRLMTQRDAALAENARLRAAVEGVAGDLIRRSRRADNASATAPHGEYHDGRADAWSDAAAALRAALAVPTADDGAERGAR